jgi:hypothetical protein
MKPIVIGLVSSAMLAVAAPVASAYRSAPVSSASHASRGAPASLPAPAPAARLHRCPPSQPSFTSLIATPTVSCREARTLNTYMTQHETLSGQFTLHGETWLGTVSSRAQNETEMVYRDGPQTIWITYGGPAS